jgi:hypothetical protein
VDWQTVRLVITGYALVLLPVEFCGLVALIVFLVRALG